MLPERRISLAKTTQRERPPAIRRYPPRQTQTRTATTQHSGRASAHNEKNPFSALVVLDGCGDRPKEKSCFCLSSSSCEPPLCFHFSPRSEFENCFAHSLHRRVLISHNDHHQPASARIHHYHFRANLLFRKATIFSRRPPSLLTNKGGEKKRTS